MARMYRSRIIGSPEEIRGMWTIDSVRRLLCIYSRQNSWGTGELKQVRDTCQSPPVLRGCLFITFSVCPSVHLSICPSLASFILASLEAFHLWSILCNVHKCSSSRAQAERAFFIACSGSAETFHLWSMFACHQGLKLNTLTDWNNSSSLYIPHQYHLFGWIPLPVSKPYISHHRLYSRVHTQSHYLTTTA